MTKLITAAGVAALLAVSPLSALAAEASGMIASVDAAAGTLTLDSGEMFVLPSTVVAASLQVGQEVTITYNQSSDGAMTALEVVPGLK